MEHVRNFNSIERIKALEFDTVIMYTRLLHNWKRFKQPEAQTNITPIKTQTIYSRGPVRSLLKQIQMQPEQ